MGYDNRVTQNAAIWLVWHSRINQIYTVNESILTWNQQGFIFLLCAQFRLIYCVNALLARALHTFEVKQKIHYVCDVRWHTHTHTYFSRRTAKSSIVWCDEWKCSFEPIQCQAHILTRNCNVVYFVIWGRFLIPC